MTELDKILLYAALEKYAERKRSNTAKYVAGGLGLAALPGAYGSGKAAYQTLISGKGRYAKQLTKEVANSGYFTGKAGFGTLAKLTGKTIGKGGLDVYVNLLKKLRG